MADSSRDTEMTAHSGTCVKEAIVQCTNNLVYMYPGEKVRVITREARYYTRKLVILRHYFASSRGARGYVRRRNFARSRVKIISARQFKGAHQRRADTIS